MSCNKSFTFVLGGGCITVLIIGLAFSSRKWMVCIFILGIWMWALIGSDKLFPFFRSNYNTLDQSKISCIVLSGISSNGKMLHPWYLCFNHWYLFFVGHYWPDIGCVSPVITIYSVVKCLIFDIFLFEYCCTSSFKYFIFF